MEAIVFCAILAAAAAASLHREEKMEVIKEDLANIGMTINNFAFDVLENVLGDSEEDEGYSPQNATEVYARKERKARSTDDQAETRQVEAPQQPSMLRDQPSMPDVLQLKPSAADEGDSVKNQLGVLNFAVREVIRSLNETQYLLSEERMRRVFLQGELRKQKQDIAKLRRDVEEITRRVAGNDSVVGSSNAYDESFSLKRLLMDLDRDGEFDSMEDSRLRELEKRLRKRRRPNVAKLLRILEDEDGDYDLPERRSRQNYFDVDPRYLENVQEVIYKLRPSGRQPKFLANFGPDVSVSPYMCVVDENNGQSGTPPSLPVNQQNYYPPAGPDSVNIERPQDYPPPEVQTGQDDMKRQIEELQAAIDSLNRSTKYAQNPEDKAAINDLKAQLDDLRNMMNNAGGGGGLQNRLKRSTADQSRGDEVLNEIAATAGKILDDEDRKSVYVQDIRQRINTIKHQLGNGQRSAEQAYPAFPQAPPSDGRSTAKDMRTTIKEDFFADLIAKIMDKIILAIPIIIKKIFNFSFDELTTFDQDGELRSIFKNLGLFGFIPAIIIRVVDGIKAFTDILRRNKFFRTFLLPVLVIVVVVVSILFLIWLLQPEDDAPYQYSYGGVSELANYSDNSQQTTNFPLYSRKYS